MLSKNYTPLDIHKFQKSATVTQPGTKTNMGPIQTVFFIILFGISLSLTGFFFYQYQKSQEQLSKATLDNTEFLVNKVGQLTIIPDNEIPSVATISQKEQLPDQPFFQSAQQGDKLLVFNKSRKAILYRPSVNKIVEVTSVNFDSEVSGASTNISESDLLSPTPNNVEKNLIPSPTQAIPRNFSVSSPTPTP